MPSGDELLDGLHRAWCWLWAGVALGLVGARELHYARTDWPRPVAAILDAAMHVAIHSVVLFSRTGVLQLVLLLGVVLALLLRPRWLLVRAESSWSARPRLRMVLWPALALNNFALDVNPWLARLSLGSLLLALFPGFPSPLRIGALLVFLGAGWIQSGTLAAASGLALWCFLLWVLLRSEALAPMDRLWLGVAGAVACQLVAAALPLAIPRHGGVEISRGMAYGFCQSTDGSAFYAVVPGSGLGPDGFLDARIDEIDAGDVALKRQVHPFSRGFRGRMIAPLCLPDGIQVAMAQTQIGDELQRENVMALSSDLNVEQRSLFGGEIGQTLFWDEERDAVFYASEWSNRIFRLDRATGRVDRSVGVGFIPIDQNHWFFFGRRYPGSLALANGLHPRRRTFYAAHWITGSTVYEIDLDTLELRSSFDARHGGTSGISVDETLDRLFVSSMWGLDVFDLNSGRPIRRLRTGFGCRTAVVDEVTDLVFVPSTIEGTIRVLDRRSLEQVGAVSMGYGTRNAFASGRSRVLLASSARAYYYFRSEELLARFASERSR